MFSYRKISLTIPSIKTSLGGPSKVNSLGMLSSRKANDLSLTKYTFLSILSSIKDLTIGTDMPIAKKKYKVTELCSFEI